MAQIKDTSIIKTPKVTVDPRLFVPDGVIDLNVKSSEDEPDSYSEFANGDLVEGDFVQDGSNGLVGDIIGGESNTLPTPQSLVVVGQTVRFAPDGKALVDITIEVEDIPGITNYELRVTKK